MVIYDWYYTQRINRVTGERTNLGCFVYSVRATVYKRVGGWAFTTVVPQKDNLLLELASHRNYHDLDFYRCIDACIGAMVTLGHAAHVTIHAEDIAIPEEPTWGRKNWINTGPPIERRL